MEADSDAALSYCAELPMCWRPLAAPLDGGERDRLSEANLRVLQQIAQMEERGAPPEEPTPQDLELARLHVKLDLLLSAIGELAPRFLDRPPRRWLQLSWSCVRWLRAELAPTPDAVGLVEVHLHPVVLTPLRWPARMRPGEGSQVEAQLLELAPASQQALERHVFQHHRRAVAEARSARRNG